MANCFRFSLLRIAAAPPRDERLNFGVVVFDHDDLRIHLPRSLNKLSAISNAFDPDAIKESANALSDLDSRIRTFDVDAESRRLQLSDFSPFDLSTLGFFEAGTEAEYNVRISELLSTLVEPEPARPTSKRQRSSRLAVDLKKAFRADRVLASKDEDLAAHRVVPHVELATGLIADFVLKNGAMHVIETVDASDETASAIKIAKDIALSALTIEQARISFGEAATIGRLVYRASPAAEALAQSALRAAEHQQIELVNWASAVDQMKLLTTISSLAEPLPKKGRNAPQHASAQHKLSIN